MKYHLLYTDKDNEFQNEEREFNSFADAEKYLIEIGAIHWEIGIPDMGYRYGEQNH